MRRGKKDDNYTTMRQSAFIADLFTIEVAECAAMEGTRGLADGGQLTPESDQGQRTRL